MPPRERVGKRKSCDRAMQPIIIHIRDELVLEAHLDADEPLALPAEGGEPDAVRMYLNEVRYLIRALGSMAAEMTGEGSILHIWSPLKILSLSICAATAYGPLPSRAIKGRNTQSPNSSAPRS
jgi:hypothetical protein